MPWLNAYPLPEMASNTAASGIEGVATKAIAGN
jgi:hypothetical protein